MPKTPDPPNRAPRALTTRQPMNWRIPFDLVTELDALRVGLKKRGHYFTRTDLVVMALQDFIAKVKKQSKAAAAGGQL